MQNRSLASNRGIYARPVSKCTLHANHHRSLEIVSLWNSWPQAITE